MIKRTGMKAKLIKELKIVFDNYKESFLNKGLMKYSKL